MPAAIPVNIKDEAEYDVYIGRPGPWGNPYRIGPDGTREQVVEQYRVWLWKQIEEDKVKVADLAELHGKRLGCYCAPQVCHGNVLATAAQWAHEKLQLIL